MNVTLTLTDAPDSSQPNSHMGPVHPTETTSGEYITSGISIVSIMHTLATITAIILALAAFYRQPIQVRCQCEQGNAIWHSWY